MNESPLYSKYSPYRSIARKAGLCHLDCNDCDCSGVAALALRNRVEVVESLARNGELPVDIIELIRATEKSGHEVVENVCPSTGHENIAIVPRKLTETGSDDDL